MARDEHTKEAARTRIPFMSAEDMEQDPEGFADKLTESIWAQIAPEEPAGKDAAPKKLSALTPGDVHDPTEGDGSDDPGEALARKRKKMPIVEIDGEAGGVSERDPVPDDPAGAFGK